MLDKHKLIIDTHCEVYKLLKPWADGEFWEFATHEIIPNSVYVFGRKQFTENIEHIRKLCERNDIQIVFDNAAEGSWTLTSQLEVLGIINLVLTRRILLIGGGDMDIEYPYIRYDHFISCILDYEENLSTMQRTDEIFTKTQKPFQFLFLNGRARPHRKYIWERLNQQQLLDRVLWTMLDGRPTVSSNFNLRQDNLDLMARPTPIQHLPPQYEVSQYRNAKIDPVPAERAFIKHTLFDNQWGEIYLQAEPYIDTYFSLITETVFDHEHSFRTEKIAKPLAMGHPWICAANAGFYRDMHNLGFQTFGTVIDESFDNIVDHQQRLERIVAVVSELCNQNLESFLRACEPMCKYNQQHLIELAPRIRSEFPAKFFNLVAKYE